MCPIHFGRKTLPSGTSHKFKNCPIKLCRPFFLNCWHAKMTTFRIVNLTSQLAESRHNQYEVWLLLPYISELWLIACSAGLLISLSCHCRLKFMIWLCYKVTYSYTDYLKKYMEQYFLKEVRKTNIYSSKMADSRKIRKFSNHWLDSDAKTVLVYMIVCLSWYNDFEVKRKFWNTGDYKYFSFVGA